MASAAESLPAAYAAAISPRQYVNKLYSRGRIYSSYLKNGQQRQRAEYPRTPITLPGLFELRLPQAATRQPHRPGLSPVERIKALNSSVLPPPQGVTGLLTFQCPARRLRKSLQHNIHILNGLQIRREGVHELQAHLRPLRALAYRTSTYQFSFPQRQRNRNSYR